MADSKLEIKVGSITFSGEGNGDWLSKQLDKVLDKIPELVAVAPPENTNNSSKIEDGGEDGPNIKAGGTLAAYLKSTSSASPNNRKFLATASWLHDSQNKDMLATRDVSAALDENKQGSVGNASECLSRNIKAGYCQKKGKMFYVTPEGKASLHK